MLINIHDPVGIGFTIINGYHLNHNTYINIEFNVFVLLVFFFFSIIKFVSLQ